MTEANASSQASPAYLIFGAYGGVGSDLAQRLAGRGAKLILAGRDSDKLSLVSDSVGARYVIADATNFAEVQEAVETAKEALGRLDGVINCVGSLTLKPAHLMSEAQWQATLSTNLTSAFACVKFASKAMFGQNGGSIVLLSSAAANIGLANHEAIAAAKAGIEGLVRSAAASYARHNIRINCVAPGLLDSGMTRSITQNPVQLKSSVDMHPLGRLGQTREIACAIDWLLSSDTTWMTGQVITLDGGLSSIKEINPSKDRTPIEAVHR